MCAPTFLQANEAVYTQMLKKEIKTSNLCYFM